MSNHLAAYIYGHQNVIGSYITIGCKLTNATLYIHIQVITEILRTKLSDNKQMHGLIQLNKTKHPT